MVLHSVERMSSVIFRFLAPAHEGRLDRLVADQTGQGRRAVRRWIEAEQVLVDGRVAKASESVAPGSEIVILGDPATALGGAPSQGQPRLRIVVDTGRYLILAKPAGLHCERGKAAGSVAELLEDLHADSSAIGDRADEGGLVHRIDRDTSGVLVAARTRESYLLLRQAFADGQAVKQYLALCDGKLSAPRQIDAPLTRRRGGMALAGRHDQALPALTHVEPLDGGANWSLVRATMRTGAMHQIRVHLASSGFPLLGDTQYHGPLLPGCARAGQLLHALRVQIGTEFDASVGPDEDFLAAYARLRRFGR